jgi:hypothetical protein
MPVRDYRAYAATPSGKAARARAHARYVAKRRERNARPIKPAVAPLVQALNNWRTL